MRKPEEKVFLSFSESGVYLGIMKHLSALILLFCSPVSLLPAQTPPPVPAVLPAAPALGLLTDLDSKPVDTAAWKGKTIILEWLDIECPCTSRHYSAGVMQKVQAEATREGVIWVTLFADHARAIRDPGFAAAIKAAMGKWAATPTHMVADADAGLARSMKINFSPAVVIITGEGKIAYRGVLDSSTLQGETSPEQVLGATNFIRQALTDIKSGRPVQLPLTPLMGCVLKGMQPEETAAAGAVRAAFVPVEKASGK